MCALQVEMSPLENASEVIENKTLQLRTLIAQCQTRQMQNINPLTMCLNGVIDAAVNGGLTRYQEVPPPLSLSISTPRFLHFFIYSSFIYPVSPAETSFLHRNPGQDY